MHRRHFIGQLASGGAVLTMPAFLAGCAVPGITQTAVAPPANPFLDWFGIDEALMTRVMTELTVNGADDADLYFQHVQKTALVMQDGAETQSSVDITQGVGLRVIVGERVGFAFTEELTLPAMLAAAREAAAAAGGGHSATAPQPFQSQATGDLYVTRVPWSDVDLKWKTPILKRVDTRARQADPAIRAVSVSWTDIDERVLIAKPDGRLIMDHRPMTRLSAQVTATRRGLSRTGFANIAARAGIGWYTDERVDGLVRDAVDRTLILFEAREPEGGEMPVILSAGTSGIVLHEAIGHALEADFNRTGESRYAGRLGSSVAAPDVTIVDQGTLPNQRGALNVDDEGTVCQRNVLVENGILRSYLHDSISARQYGVPVTGSGRRESYRHAPMPRMTSTFMHNGPHTRDEIVAAVDRGIIADTYTNGRVDLGGGNFTFNVKNGWQVEGGRITAPIRDLQLIGNGPECLERMTMVADDSRLDPGGWTCGKQGQRVPVSQGMPSVLVSRLAVRRSRDA